MPWETETEVTEVKAFVACSPLQPSAWVLDATGELEAHLGSPHDEPNRPPDASTHELGLPLPPAPGFWVFEGVQWWGTGSGCSDPECSCSLHFKGEYRGATVEECVHYFSGGCVWVDGEMRGAIEKHA